jgi:F-type H+-transporting ATPase subunit epsilon
MHLVIAKIDESLFDGEAYSLTAPGSDGEMTILGAHEPLITTLKTGDLRVHVAQGDQPQLFPITGGVLEIRPEGVTVIL